MKNLLWVIISSVLCISSVEAAINDWTNPFSAKWESPSWSLETLPASDQSVNIKNEGYKAGNIDSATVWGYGSSLTVRSLEGLTPTKGLSTLRLNYYGLNMLLRMLNYGVVLRKGTIRN